MVVEGTSAFPIDMLRYDRCVPYYEQDAGEIAASVSRWGTAVPKARITLLHFDANPVKRGEARMAYGRWESFGWKVISEEPIE
jgi:hypothetical protein